MFPGAPGRTRRLLRTAIRGVTRRLRLIPIVADGWALSPAYLRGVELFNAGYYWEAHESWEALWHAHGRRGPTAGVLQGLIKLAAAGVKIRERKAGWCSYSRVPRGGPLRELSS